MRSLVLLIAGGAILFLQVNRAHSVAARMPRSCIGVLLGWRLSLLVFGR